MSGAKGDMLVIRKVNREVFKKFKQKALEENMGIGNAITAAMLEWINKKNHSNKPDIRNLRKIEGIIKAGRKVRWSEEIDKTLYG